MIRRPPRSTQSRSSAASDVYKRQRLYSVLKVLQGRVSAAAGDAWRKPGPSRQQWRHRAPAETRGESRHPAFLSAGGPLRVKSGHFGPFPAQGKLLPVLLIYFLFETLPQKRCSALPDDNGTGKRDLRVHLQPFSSHFRHFGGQYGRQNCLQCPYRPQIPTSCTQFAIRSFTWATWDQ